MVTPFIFLDRYIAAWTLSGVVRDPHLSGNGISLYVHEDYYMCRSPDVPSSQVEMQCSVEVTSPLDSLCLPDSSSHRFQFAHVPKETI